MAAALVANTANVVTTATPIAKPAVEALVNWTPYNRLQRADAAQALTLDMLEGTAGIMKRDLHDHLQSKYDSLAEYRSDMGDVGPLKAWKKMGKIYKYGSGADKLNRKTVTSSQAARSRNIWKTKGATNGSPSSDSQSDTIGGTQVDDQEPGAAGDHISEDITDADPFRETDSAIVHYAGAAFSICESESVYSQSGESVYNDAFPLQTFRSSS
ncbi:hypothetical protein POSPLADRAFT_1068849 [Postia placenta MAD-698-R-SB12]|uniref:Uncharacterized protein n=1 Tax=Postia placenta MAD-698-R-SB12 TaxID=670580 RepID=A0A1X6NBG4_9APHY|nr:hypothetical protein POSPLADRAFT_1068849 [Postia placenta MAD-698-R-SB12]OSX65914.1 hypothetical protein POSPLADRAFT_1068849 [Postia placenta MAD-698-R-SB12]